MKKDRLLQMKMSGRNVVAILGFALLGVIVAGGFVVGMLFVFPKLKIGSMTAVDERNSQTIYRGPEIKEILTSRNFIVESETVHVRFWMRKEGQGAKSEENLKDGQPPEGSIVVEESATGLSFNSVKRTHVEWTRTSVDGETYFRIKVLEPKGLIKRKTASIVYINLWRDSRVPEGESTAPYNFILQNGKSVVSFGGDPVNAEAPEMLHIDTLTVQSAGAVYLPMTPTTPTPTGKLLADIQNIKVTGSGVPVDARCDITGSVEITGAGNAVTLSSVAGSLNVSGNGNAVTVENQVLGAVTWGVAAARVPAGSLNIRGTCGNLSVYTTDAGISASVVTGGVIMNTVNGGLRVGEIMGGGLDFRATGTAGVSVGAVMGAVAIPEMGSGGISVSNVHGEVNIKSDRTNAGGIGVSFYPELTGNPAVNIVGYDGGISVSNIRGKTNISVRDWENGTGRANIYAHFLRVDADVSITANMGYINGHETEANITVDLPAQVWAALRIIGTSYAVNDWGEGGAYLSNSHTGNPGATYYLLKGDKESFPAAMTDEEFWSTVESLTGQTIAAADRSDITVRTTTRFYLK